MQFCTGGTKSCKNRAGVNLFKISFLTLFFLLLYESTVYLLFFIVVSFQIRKNKKKEYYIYNQRSFKKNLPPKYLLDPTFIFAPPFPFMPSTNSCSCPHLNLTVHIYTFRMIFVPNSLLGEKGVRGKTMDE